METAIIIESLINGENFRIATERGMEMSRSSCRKFWRLSYFVAVAIDVRVGWRRLEG
jgi:hypothetical protein